MKCKICYAQIKKNSNICDYCGTQITIENYPKESENISKASKSDLDRLSPEFRRILESKSSKKLVTNVEDKKLLVKDSYEDINFKKKPTRKWGIVQSVIEFFFFCGILGMVDGNLDQENVVVSIYLIWSSIRAFNFFVLKKNK